MGLNQTVANWVSSRVGQRIGDDGECWTLVETALTESGAKNSNDIMRGRGVTADADYRWGRAVSLRHLQVGDIIQFRNYRVSVTTPTADGGSRTETSSRPHHSAIVAAIINRDDGIIEVFEQNIPQGGAVRRTTLYFHPGERNISIHGRWWFYRPLPRSHR